jgi:hypothetical protein
MEELQMTRWGFALSAVLSVACVPDGAVPRNRIEGSVSSVIPTGYDTARIQVSLTDVAINFVRERKVDATDAGSDGVGINEDTVLSLAFPWTQGVVPVKTRIDLNPTDGGATFGACSRNVLNDPRRTFPKIVRGTVLFDAALEPGTRVVGDFHVTFENGIEAASGRTLFSTFEATVQ